MQNEKWLDEFLDESIPLWRNDPVLFMRDYDKIVILMIALYARGMNTCQVPPLRDL